ncbi:MAG: DUF2892 domain-containing protein [Maribacter sp.]|nr:DUF2892 domain-containing protein [Maribacter sp.]
MKKNLGGLDRFIRITLALVAGLLVYFEMVGDTLSIILLAVAAVFVITSLVGFCPLYGLVGLNSCSVKHD